MEEKFRSYDLQGLIATNAVSAFCLVNLFWRIYWNIRVFSSGTVPISNLLFSNVFLWNFFTGGIELLTVVVTLGLAPERYHIFLLASVVITGVLESLQCVTQRRIQGGRLLGIFIYAFDWLCSLLLKGRNANPLRNRTIIGVSILTFHLGSLAVLTLLSTLPYCINRFFLAVITLMYVISTHISIVTVSRELAVKFMRR